MKRKATLDDAFKRPVPDHVTGLRLNETTRNVEVMNGLAVVEVIDILSIDDATTVEQYKLALRSTVDRLKEIRASLPSAAARRKWMRDAEKIMGRYVDLADRDMWLRDKRDEVMRVADWAAEKITLQKPGKIRKDEIVDCAIKGLIFCEPRVLQLVVDRFVTHPPKVFTVEHDWAAALSGADDYELGEWRLPYDSCFFEMRASDRSVCVYVCDDDFATVFVEIDGGWVAFNEPEDISIAPDCLSELCEMQIRAICIALDAEVATKEVVRVEAKLNAAREKRGKRPLSDYHIVKLARRERVEPCEGGGDKHRSPRLHFVRGHWRHYSSHSTWINWYLRGDPDLGFIDKHYAL